MDAKLNKEMKLACLVQCGFRIISGQLQDAAKAPDGLKVDRKYGLKRWLNNQDGAKGRMTTYKCCLDESLPIDGIRTYNFDVVISDPVAGGFVRYSEELKESFTIRVRGEDNDILAAGTDSEISSAISSAAHPL